MTTHDVEKSVDDFKMYDSGTMAEPNEFWTLLRETAPVHRVDEGLGYTLVSRYADVQDVLRDPDTFRNGVARFFDKGSPHPDSPAVAAVMADAAPYREVLGFGDGEAHARHRRMVRAGFTTRRVRQLEGFVSTVVDDLLDELVTGEPVDFVKQFCKRLPILLIGEIMGVEKEREHDVYRWATSLMARAAAPPETEDDALRIARDVVEFHQYVYKAVADRRESPRDDFLSELVANSEGIDEHELAHVCAQLILAGADTTIAWLGSIFDLLLAHPDQLAELYADRSLIPNAMEEALRLQSVIKTIYRATSRDAEVAGQDIPADSLVIPLLGSANRDDAVFPDAATFDIHRPNVRKHMAFGFGTHLCAGIELARAEARISLTKVLERTSALSRVEGEPLPKYVPDFTIRGIDRLPMILHPAER
ncbi:cytochrome P450 [Geodermatophilus amargosae]|nr:cytochrome P450 [Geodermatophilus amargosae]